MAKKKKKRKFSLTRLIILIIVITLFAGVGAVIGIVAAAIRNAPEIDPRIILSLLTESSNLVDDKGNVIEIIQSTDDRKIVTLDDIPDYMEDAFISIEDHRFEEHFGIDLRRIAGSMLHNIKVGDLKAQGASTITQQLARNLYLSGEKKYDRKIKEMYLAIEMERALTKEQILEYYLNTIPLGQSNNGVQAASFAYFSKDVGDLTIAEAALLAGVPKADSKYAPYKKIRTGDDTDIEVEDIVGYVYVAGTKYTCIYNELSVERQKTVLFRMHELGKITDTEYEEALEQDIRTSLNPGQKKSIEISSYFTDYVKNQVVEDLVTEYGYTYGEAESLLYTGGLTIYSTMDFDVQRTLEESYNNFAQLLLGDLENETTPYVEEWKSFSWRSDGTSIGNLDGNENVLNEKGRYLYFKKENLVDEGFNVVVNPNEYHFDENNNLFIDSKKFNLYSTVIDIVDYYTIKDNFLVTHEVGGLNIGENFEIISSYSNKGEFKISGEYLNSAENFYTIDSEDNLVISNTNFFYDEKGIFQPQSAAVIMDYHSGEIKALIGGRNITTGKSFNRAVSAERQPGSTIKPLAVYLPALDTGYTAASIIDDVPRYNNNGQRWPKNWYEHQTYKYWGLTTLRKSVEYSLNVNAVKMLEYIGFDTSLDYLNKLNLVDFKNPSNDSFITPEENRSYNDLNLAAMALGGLTNGFTPLDMTAAYGAIANDGVYIEPYSYTKVVDSNGIIILEKEVESNYVVSPQISFIMKDILRSTVTQGLSYNASLPSEYGIEVAGKTGTTSDNGDIWFMGFSPYYVGGIWIGNDNSQMRVGTGSSSTARLWGNIMKEVHNGLEAKEFLKPEGIIQVAVCSQSGLLPTEFCQHDQRGSSVINEYFVKGTEPTSYCKTHVEASVCTASGMIQGSYCPLDTVESKVYIARESLYDPIMNPYIKSNSYYTLLENYNLYIKIKNEIQNRSYVDDAAIENAYNGIIQVYDGQISHVNGIAVEDLVINGLLTKDYNYQLPVKECDWHNSFHWNNYLNSLNETNSSTTDDE